MRVWWDKRLKVMRISTIAIVTTLIILLFFAGFTIYGNKVGNFVINVDMKTDIRLALSGHEDLSEQTERLAYTALMELNDTTYEWLPADLSSRGVGNVSDTDESRFMAYSFYLINNSDRAVDCKLDLNLLDTVGDPLGMIRVMLIEEENGTFAEGNRIYALPESSPERAERLENDLRYNHKPYDVEYFPIDEGKLFSVSLRDFGEGASRKYTVVIWLEGCDLDCTNDQVGSRVKLQLDIVGY